MGKSSSKPIAPDVGDLLVVGFVRNIPSLPYHNNQRFYSLDDIYRNNNLDKLDKNDKIIRISVLKHKSIPADIKPNNNFKWNEWIISGDLNDNLQRFNRGYHDAGNISNIINCIKKGLIWNNINCNYNDNNNKWNNHLTQKIKEWNMKIKTYIETM